MSGQVLELARRAPEPFVEKEAVAELLDLHPDTIKRWASQGKIPCYKRNGTVRFRLSEVEEWFLEGRREPRRRRG